MADKDKGPHNDGMKPHAQMVGLSMYKCADDADCGAVVMSRRAVGRENCKLHFFSTTSQMTVWLMIVFGESSVVNAVSACT